eukprot:58813-Rhodomonas_salina.1
MAHAVELGVVGHRLLLRLRPPLQLRRSRQPGTNLPGNLPEIYPEIYPESSSDPERVQIYPERIPPQAERVQFYSESSREHSILLVGCDEVPTRLLREVRY